MYFIYLIENLINGKMYVGQTVDLSRRQRAHFSPSSKCPYLSNAIKKYGKDNFDFCILESCGTDEAANTKEIFWINKLNVLAPNGYNLREGGVAGGSPSRETIEKVRKSNTGKKQPREVIEKRAAANRGRKNTPETIEKMRIAAQNRPPEKCSMFGRQHSKETKLKMSISSTKTHCKRGHPLEGSEADVHVAKAGNRNCRICRRFRRSGTVWNPSSF